jgi:nucleoside-diphosphate-sugar epimerase
MRLIVTGTSGFVGTNLIKYFNQKSQHIITPFSLRGVSLINFTGDGIIHLAGKAHDLKKAASDSEYFEINAELTKTLYSAFLQSDAEVFIFISSVKAAADILDGILDESYIPDPQTAYGKSKLQAEQFILANLPNNKRVFILRPCMIHGPGNKGNLNLLYKFVVKGIPWPLGSFETKRSFCSVENLCFVIKELIERYDIPSGIYNIADDLPVGTNEIIQLIGKSKNKDAKIWYIPKSLIKLLATLGDFFKLPLNSERLKKLSESFVVNNAKLIKALGKPLPISSKKGLEITLKSFNKKC